MGDRAMALHLARLSPVRTAAAWTSYLVSLVPCAARHAAADAVQERALRAQLRVAFGLASASWMPDCILAGVAIRYQVPSAPRCPVAAARAAAARAHAMEDFWGPRTAQKRARIRWNKLI
eukprot:521474-Pyramimonas_sp.AAC.1